MNKWSLNLIIAAIAFNLGYTWAFGWNWTPQSRLEAVMDCIAATMVAIAVFIQLVTGKKEATK